MTRNAKDEEKRGQKAKKLRVKKETIKDLEPTNADKVKGGPKTNGWGVAGGVICP